MATYRVRGPDGAVHVFEGPDGATPEQVEAFAAQTFGQKPAKAPESDVPAVPRAMANLVGGAVRGAGSIGATLMWPLDKATDLIQGARGGNLSGLITGAGAKPLSRNEQRRQDMDDALQSMGFDPSSNWYGAGKLAAEVAGTMGAGGAVANVATRAAPALATRLPGLVEAVRTGGMSAGGAGMGTRIAGGAVAGGASAGLVDPKDAALGAGLGGAVPPLLAGVGRAGQAVGAALKSASQGPQARSGADLIRALELQNPQDVQAAVQALRQAPELVPGSRPTVAQALQTPQAGILQRVVHDSGGGSALRDQLAAQNAARQAALEGVAPTAPGGYATARQDMGQAIADFAVPQRQAAKAQTRAAYEAVPQDEAALYLPDLASVRDKYFGLGSFAGRGAVDAAVNTADEVGRGVVAGTPAERGLRALSLSQAVRRAGGLSIAESSGRRGEVDALRGDLKNLVRVNGGERLDQMAQRMHEAGYIADDGVDTLINALKDDSRGGGVFSFFDHPAPAEAVPASSTPQKVTLAQFDNLRKDIGAALRAAERDPERAREAAALAEMKRSLDDRVDQVVRGDGAVDEVLPIEWANQLDRARKLKVDEVARFGTGPQRDIFRKGADGQPVVQGGEVAGKFWGNRPGLADDVGAFRRLIDDNPRLLSQFRSMVTTEGAATAGMDGKLAGKFAKWVDAMKPGITRAFEPEQVDLLQRIAADIRRSETAASAGMARGSNTYQNAQNALNLGLLDSPLLGAAANRVPVVNSVSGPALGWLRDTAREAKARRLAGVLSDSQAAADALAAAGITRPGAAQQMLTNPALRGLFYRGLPVAGATAGDR